MYILAELFVLLSSLYELLENVYFTEHTTGSIRPPYCY